MSNRLRQLTLALAMSGLTALAWSQAAPDSGAAGAGPGPAEHGAHRPWGGRDGSSGEEHGDRGDRGDRGDHSDHGGWRHHRHHHHHHHHHHHGHHGRGRGMMAGAGMMRMFHSLNLTAAQHQQVQSILANERAQFWKERANQKPGSAPDFAALANPGDSGYTAAVQAAKKRAADRIQHVSDLKTQLYNVLTPEQKSQWSKNIADWKARRMAQRGDGARGRPAPADR